MLVALLKSHVELVALLNRVSNLNADVVMKDGIDVEEYRRITNQLKGTIMKSYAGERKLEYVEYLCGRGEWKSSLYNDPDVDFDGEFYKLLVSFLNKQSDKYDDTWKYRLSEPKIENNKYVVPRGIEVFDNQQAILYLRSDQYGFSAPQGKMRDKAWDICYPYGSYILKEDNKEEAARLVANFIWTMRSIGGCFVWPINNNEGKDYWRSRYNVNRGVSSYIEDRVDLTLMEIKEFYASWSKNKNLGGSVDEVFFKVREELRNKGIILLKAESDSKLIFIWLTHFESFEKYVEFFFFDEFVDKDSKEYIPLDITSYETNLYGKNKKKKILKNIERCELGKIKDMSAEDIKHLLLNRTNIVLERYKAINSVVQREYSGKYS